jgi:tellurite resistance protein
MVLFIIFGTRGLTSTAKRGQFYCPGCSDSCEYAHKKVRRFFTLYFIPLIPLDSIGEYVECGRCKSTWELSVLDLTPGTNSDEFEAEFHKAIKQVMLLMMVADGVIDDNEVATIAQVYEGLTGKTITESAIRSEGAALQQSGQGLKEYLKTVVGKVNDHGKELVIKAAYSIAAADGEFQAEEKEMLAELGAHLEMTPAHLNGVIAGLAGE